jgi:hypothetical protein
LCWPGKKKKKKNIFSEIQQNKSGNKKSTAHLFTRRQSILPFCGWISFDNGTGSSLKNRGVCGSELKNKTVSREKRNDMPILKRKMTKWTRDIFFFIREKLSAIKR